MTDRSTFMSNWLVAVSIFIMGLCVSHDATAQGATTDQVKLLNLKIAFSGLRSSKGKVLVQLFRSKKGFPTEAKDAFKAISLSIAEGGSARTEFSDLAPGTYAVAAVHDENESGGMDTNWIGIPREGLGISRDAKGRFGPPSFDDAALQLTDDQEIKITFVYL